MKREHIIVGASIVVTGVVIYAIIKRHNNKLLIAKINATLDGGSVNNVNLVKVNVTTLPSASFPLKSGSYGRQVAEVQSSLNRKYQTGIDVDGKMGQQTLTALCKYENAWCLFGKGSSLITVNEIEYQNIIS